ncbi:MAG: CHAT domain-containing protein [Acidobacteria bacterium]|nr:CHAT domain-containing protein [Acidobacteriota bacterium]
MSGSEPARARAFLELLFESRTDVKSGVDPDLKKREESLQHRVSWIQSQLIELQSQPGTNVKRLALLGENLKNTDLERDRLEVEIKEKHPRYAGLKYPTPLGLEAIRQQLDDETVLLEYFVGKEGSYLFGLTKVDYLAARLPAARELADRVERLRNALALPRSGNLTNFPDQARWLYQKLVRPAERLLAGKRRLVVVPDGVLHYLPFEVLPRSGVRNVKGVDPSRLQYLIRDFAISYTPSMTVLANLRGYSSERIAPPQAFLAYADPIYGKGAPAANSAPGKAIRSAFGAATPREAQAAPLDTTGGGTHCPTV